MQGANTKSAEIKRRIELHLYLCYELIKIWNNETSHRRGKLSTVLPPFNLSLSWVPSVLALSPKMQARASLVDCVSVQCAQIYICWIEFPPCRTNNALNTLVKAFLRKMKDTLIKPIFYFKGERKEKELSKKSSPAKANDERPKFAFDDIFSSKFSYSSVSPRWISGLLKCEPENLIK